MLTFRNGTKSGLPVFAKLRSTALPPVQKPLVTMALTMALVSYRAFPQEKVGQTIQGPVRTSFKPASKVWFTVRTTRLIPTTDAKLIVDLKDYGFTATAAGFTRSRNRGTEWIISQKGYRPLQQEKPVQARVTGTYHYFSNPSQQYTWSQLIGKDGGWINQVQTEPVTKIKREYTGRRVQEQTGWVQHPDLYGGIPAPTYDWVDEYVDRRIIVKPGMLVNKAVADSHVPNAPFALPPKIAVGTNLKFTLDGAPNITTKWRVTRLYQQGNSSFAEGQLKSANDAVAVVSGTMTVRTNEGIVERVDAKVNYPKGRWDDNLTHGAWTYRLEVARVSKARYQQAQAAEGQRWAALGTTSPLWSSDVAEARIISTRWTIKNTPFVVRFGPKQTYSITLDGKKKEVGTWKIVDRRIELTVKDARYFQYPFVFSLATKVLEPKEKGDDFIRYLKTALDSNCKDANLLFSSVLFQP